MTTRELRRLKSALRSLIRDLEIGRDHGGRWINASSSVTYLELIDALDAAERAALEAKR